MSLDVYLESEPTEHICECLECGNRHTTKRTNLMFSANITHNLNKMANEAKIYQVVWRPEEIGIKKAKQIIEPLREGIALMKAQPSRFKTFNAANGWGLYEHFVPWLERYLTACEEFPDATVRVSR